jgi:hypothetical protein
MKLECIEFADIGEVKHDMVEEKWNTRTLHKIKKMAAVDRRICQQWGLFII